MISNKKQSLTNVKMDRVMTLSNSEEGLLEMDQKTGLLTLFYVFEIVFVKELVWLA